MPKKTGEKFQVSGVEKLYDDFGPALSRSITEASKRDDDTVYVVLDGDIVASSTSSGAKRHVTTVQLR